MELGCIPSFNSGAVSLIVMLYDYTEIPTRIKLVESKNESMHTVHPESGNTK